LLHVAPTEDIVAAVTDGAPVVLLVSAAAVLELALSSDRTYRGAEPVERRHALVVGPAVQLAAQPRNERRWPEFEPTRQDVTSGPGGRPGAERGRDVEEYQPPPGGPRFYP